MKADPATRAAVLKTVDAFTDAYRRGDVDGVLAYIAPDDDVVLIGTGADEKRIGLAEARMQVERDHAQTDTIAMQLLDPIVSARGDVAWLSADLHFEGTAGGESFRIPGRLTAVFEQRDGEWLMVNSHFSAPMADQSEGESFPS
jgi:ketosteroid isomerase-like protein